MCKKKQIFRINNFGIVQLLNLKKAKKNLKNEPNKLTTLITSTGLCRN